MCLVWHVASRATLVALGYLVSTIDELARDDNKFLIKVIDNDQIPYMSN